MILSYTNKFIFIKTPKTAGTSVQQALQEYCKPPDAVMYGHREMLTGVRQSTYEEFMTIDCFPNSSGYFTFGFTRNPYDLVLSRYFYQIKRKRLSEQYKPVKFWFNVWLHKKYAEEYTGVGCHSYDRARKWLFDDNLKQSVDFIGRFEDLEKDFKYVCDVIGLKNVQLQHLNRSNVVVVYYQDWYTKESKELIEKLYDFELEYFKYRF